MRDLLTSRLAAEQHGVVSGAQLRALGLDADAIRRRVAAGRLHRIHRGVYAVGHAAITLKGAFLAAVLACGEGAVLSHWSAAELWELLDPEPMLAHVTAPLPRRHPDIKTHAALLHARDITRRDGIPTMTPARTVLALAENTSVVALRRPVRRALALRLTSVPAMLEVVNRHPGHRGVIRLRAVLAEGHVPTRSELEDTVYDLILSGELAPPKANESLSLGDQRVIPDLLWPEKRLIVEADSRTWHEDPLSRQDDAERQALLEAHGYRVIRITWADAVRRPTQTLRRIAAALD